MEMQQLYYVLVKHLVYQYIASCMLEAIQGSMETRVLVTMEENLQEVVHTFP